MVYVSAQLPANAFSAVEIQDHRDIDVLVQQLDVCDIRDPGLVQPGYLCVFQKVWLKKPKKDCVYGGGFSRKVFR